MPDRRHEWSPPSGSGAAAASRRWRGRGFFLAGLAGVILIAAGCATTPPIPMRGSLHHTTPSLISTQPFFEVQTVVANDGTFRLRFVSYEEKEFRLIEFYEKVLEYQGKGERDPTKIRRVTVPGEYLEVQGEVKRQRQGAGSLAREKINLNGIEATLTAEGIFEDRAGLVLRFFDDLELGENAELTLQIQLPKLEKLGTKTLVLTRRQLMECLGIAWDAPTGSANNGLTTTVTPSAAKLQPGGELMLTLTVENRGAKAVAKVMGRTFSRHVWLNGRNFYLGTLMPGEKRTATRSFRVPAAAAGSGPIFAEIGLWDINKGDRLGEDVVRNFPLTFHVLPATQTP